MSAGDLAREGFRAFNENDQDGFRAMLADDVVYREFATHTEAHGKDEVMAAVFKWKIAEPDMVGPVDRMTVEGDRVACEVVWRGTHTGPLQMPDGSVVPPSGKSTAITACGVLTFKDDKLAEMNHYYDALWFLMDIGAVPGGAG